jgi:hypothetical protein
MEIIKVHQGKLNIKSISVNENKGICHEMSAIGVISIPDCGKKYWILVAIQVAQIPLAYFQNILLVCMRGG